LRSIHESADESNIAYHKLVSNIVFDELTAPAQSSDEYFSVHWLLTPMRFLFENNEMRLLTWERAWESLK